MSERLICTCDWPGDKECPRHPEKSLTQAADELGPIVKAWMREAYQEWPDDREVLIARKLLASDWLAAVRAAAWEEGYARGSEDEFAWCGGDKRAPHENPYRVESETS